MCVRRAQLRGWRGGWGVGVVTQPMAQMEALGRAGFTVSVCCGPCGRAPFRWTVQVLAPNGEEFDRPFAANDFAHAIEIAVIEIQKRGWIPLLPASHH